MYMNDRFFFFLEMQIILLNCITLHLSGVTLTFSGVTLTLVKLK